MTTTGMIYDYLNSLAPFETQMGFDNSGLLIGSVQRQVDRVMVALDASLPAAVQAAERHCQLLITHHPVIFRPAKSISGDGAVYRLISGGVDVISAHTNLDIAEGGVNSCLADALGFAGFERPEWLELGVCGTLDRATSAAELGEYVAKKLACDGVRVVDGGKPVRSVALIGGSGGSEWSTLADHVDALITGEARHNEIIEARDAGFTLIIAGHYETESVVVAPLCRMLSERFPEVEFICADEPNPVTVTGQR
ncbi:MAG: Nif3-like dinuclear metal center hexameric protein [Ruminococcaceae bacterium]|nr:Nif3-like dinuclear metal center hexameric protein [Oscillospiraceae bacterium]